MADTNVIALAGTQLKETLVLIDDVTGQISVPVTLPVNPNHLSSKEYVDNQIGTLITPADLNNAINTLAPQSEITRLENEIALKADASSLTSLSQDVLHLSGGNIIGPITYSEAPSDDEELTNKAYVDAQIAIAISATPSPSPSLTIKGPFTPVDGAEYPPAGVSGDSWIISGLGGTELYTFIGGSAAGRTTKNGDQLIWGTEASDWFLVNFS